MDSFEEKLAAAVDESVRAYPELAIDREEARARLERACRSGASGDDEAERALASIRAADFLFAQRCGGGDAKALALFEQRFRVDLEIAIKRVVRDAAARDELVQQLREKLFVGRDGGAPKILDFAGRGELRHWLRATAARHALNAATRNRREEPFEERLFDALEAPGADPELLHAKEHYRAELKTAFAEAAGALEPRDRNLLRYACTERLGIDAIGAVYGVHRATAARWVTAARERLLSGVRKALLARLKVAPRELDSILRVVQSGVSITLERYLAEDPAAP